MCAEDAVRAVGKYNLLRTAPFVPNRILNLHVRQVAIKP
jgi:hypothetical protein